MTKYPMTKVVLVPSPQLTPLAQPVPLGRFPALCAGVATREATRQSWPSCLSAIVGGFLLDSDVT